MKIFIHIHEIAFTVQCEPNGTRRKHRKRWKSRDTRSRQAWVSWCAYVRSEESNFFFETPFDWRLTTTKTNQNKKFNNLMISFSHSDTRKQKTENYGKWIMACTHSTHARTVCVVLFALISLGLSMKFNVVWVCCCHKYQQINGRLYTFGTLSGRNRSPVCVICTVSTDQSH